MENDKNRLNWGRISEKQFICSLNLRVRNSFWYHPNGHNLGFL